jgi:hypothetical protein
MKRIIRQDGPKSTDRALVVDKLLHHIAKEEIYGETMGEVGARFVDLALQRFVELPRFVIGRIRRNDF